ncbi:MAG TPA: hypothetical protein DEA40_15425, partial [Parvularcula sp.]|nr:hypothetical protein [Parvularcula sp.]
MISARALAPEQGSARLFIRTRGQRTKPPERAPNLIVKEPPLLSKRPSTNKIAPGDPWGAIFGAWETHSGINTLIRG